MRLREFSDKIPKPMVPIGYRPILWYIMKYYAHFGHKDFILCLGYQGDTIKNYFMNYSEYTSNDFVYAKGGSYVNLINKDIEDWTITFADTGINATMGERLTIYDPATQTMLSQLKAGFVAAGADAFTATNRAYYALSGMLQRQAAMVSFVTIFRGLGFLFLILIPLVLLMRRPRTGAVVDAGH